MTAAWCDIDSNQDTYVAKAIIMCLDVCINKCIQCSILWWHDLQMGTKSLNLKQKPKLSSQKFWKELFSLFCRQEKYHNFFDVFFSELIVRL